MTENEKQDININVQPEEPAHRVTLGSMFVKLENIDDKVNILVDRDKRDYETIQRHDHQIETLKKWVYFCGVPLLGVASVVLGIDLISPLL